MTLSGRDSVPPKPSHSAKAFAPMHVTPSGIRSSPEKPSYANAYAPIVFSVDGSVRVPVILPIAGELLY